MKNLICVITFLIMGILSGCLSQVASFRDHINGWIGGSMDEYIEIGKMPHIDRSGYVGVEGVTRLDNGNMLYEIPFPECPAFFEVNPRGIIVAITTEGDRDCY